MDQPTPDASGAAAPTVEHSAASIPRGFTAWHQYFAQALKRTKAPGLHVDCFVKLGELPLEADIILLHRDPSADLAEFAQYFDFLVPCLRRYLIVEYKSPDDRLTYQDFGTVRAYAQLCKRLYPIDQDADVAVAMLYSHTKADFFDRCAHDGYRFEPTRPGVRSSSPLSLAFYTLDLTVIGEQQPDHPINLLSSRRRMFGSNGLPVNLGPFGVLYEQLFYKELKTMSQLSAPGYQELLEDAQRLNELMLSRCSVEERLRGLAPDDLLPYLAPEDRLRGLAPEDRLRGLAPDDLLRGLDDRERTRLLELLLKQTQR